MCVLQGLSHRLRQNSSLWLDILVGVKKYCQTVDWALPWFYSEKDIEFSKLYIMSRNFFVGLNFKWQLVKKKIYNIKWGCPELPTVDTIFFNLDLTKRNQCHLYPRHWKCIHRVYILDRVGNVWVIKYHRGKY